MKLYAGAGEASGDRILAALLEGLRKRFPDLEVRGYGGPLSAAQGLRSPFSLRDLAVNGLADVLKRLVFLARTRARLHRELEKFRPDLVLLVDYPGMNVGLARHALRLDIPVHYVAPPQLWAYRRPEARLRRLHEALQGASLQFLFPFEQEAYGGTARATQGHFFPAPSQARTPGTRLLLCPGSRRNVLRRNLPPWLDRLRAAGLSFADIDVLVPDYLAGDARNLCATQAGIRIVTDRDRAFADARAAIAFPGTLTLELFLARVPARVWAVVDPLTARIGARALRGPWLSLPNILAGTEVFPEWAGTPGAFRRRPPNLPADLKDWNRPVETDLVRAVWKKIGSDQGVEEGVKACLSHLEKLRDAPPKRAL